MHKTIEITLTKDLLESAIHDLQISNNGLCSFIAEYKGLVKKYKNAPNRVETFKSVLKRSQQKYKEKQLLIENLKKQKEEFNA